MTAARVWTVGICVALPVSVDAQGVFLAAGKNSVAEISVLSNISIINLRQALLDTYIDKGTDGVDFARGKVFHSSSGRNTKMDEIKGSLSLNAAFEKVKNSRKLLIFALGAAPADLDPNEIWASALNADNSYFTDLRDPPTVSAAAATETGGKNSSRQQEDVRRAINEFMQDLLTHRLSPFRYGMLDYHWGVIKLFLAQREGINKSLLTDTKAGKFPEWNTLCPGGDWRDPEHMRNTHQLLMEKDRYQLIGGKPPTAIQMVQILNRDGNGIRGASGSSSSNAMVAVADAIGNGMHPP
ncbi:hypothetical protein B484DRAFT_411915 [Ochromonadaceae sp. CCMP2298]|nr:hypothetical protein B484DRAFT_411915 [Ochromonadaceae sp. CCMP2298]